MALTRASTILLISEVDSVLVLSSARDVPAKLMSKLIKNINRIEEVCIATINPLIEVWKRIWLLS